MVAGGLASWPGKAGAAGPPDLAQTPPKGNVSAKPSVYIHPKRNYQLILPPDATLLEEGANVDVSIRSRRGYVINIQAGLANPRIGLGKMVGLLESRYLGPGRPWSLKMGEDDLTVGGLPARKVGYLGSGTRSDVVIARGAKTDFVFMFFAPPDSFEPLSLEFAAVLASFKPPAAELTKRAPAAGGHVPGKQALGAHVLEKKTFSDLGYRINYPLNWTIERPSAFAILFGGPEGTPAYFATISIQNISPPAATRPERAFKAVYKDLKAQLSKKDLNATYFKEDPFIYEKQKIRLLGKKFLVGYTIDGQRYKQLTIVMPRPDFPVVYIWSYRAPQDRFHIYLPAIQKSLDTWTLEITGAQ